MFNNQFNQGFNLGSIPQWLAVWLIDFEGYDFMSLCTNGKYGTIIQTWGDENSLNADLESYVSSLVDWGGIVSKKYGNKTITFSLFIQWESHDDLLLRMDELKRATQKVEWNLAIKVLWSYRVYTATVQSISFPSVSKNDDFLENIRVSFLITSWTWKELQLTSQAVNMVWEVEKIIFNVWTYEAFPYFAIACRSAGNEMTKININIRRLWEVWGNDVYIEENITNNDLVIFDYQKAIVTINGIEKPFYNPMTPLDTGNNVVTITPTGTANCELSISYNKTYL